MSAAEEGDAERARLGRRGAREREVGAEQRPAGEEPGARSERDAGSANTEPAWLKYRLRRMNA